VEARKRQAVLFGWAGSEHVRRWVLGLQSREYAVRLVSLGGEPVENVSTTIFHDSGKLSYALRAPQAAFIARRFKPDILHVHYALGFGLWGQFARVRPTVVSVWGSDIAETATSRLSKSLVRRALHWADWITATSQNLAEETCRLFPEAAEKTSVIPFGVTVPDSCPPPPENGELVRLCFIKMHRPVYGPEVLIRAVEKALQSDPNIRLSIAGDGEMTEHLKRMVRYRDLDKQITFTGYIPNYRIYQFIQEHDIMVMPSLREAFGVAALEAGACGRPVIASRVGGVPEVILNGRTGLLVPPEDVDALASAIITMAADAAMRQTMGQAAFEYVRDNYSWNQSLDQMTALYERLIDEHKKKHSAV
jgi:glycosyltransferase involved in cell wall biosynthesis